MLNDAVRTPETGFLRARSLDRHAAARLVMTASRHCEEAVGRRGNPATTHPPPRPPTAYPFTSTRAGLPTTVAPGGTLWVTTAPMPTTAPRPITSGWPGRPCLMTAPLPM